MSKHLAAVFSIWLFTATGVGAAEARLPAFPGAEGAGAYTPGGRGGKVYLVTTLADYRPGREKPIPGSLRAAVDAKDHASSFSASRAALS